MYYFIIDVFYISTRTHTYTYVCICYLKRKKFWLLPGTLLNIFPPPQEGLRGRAGEDSATEGQMIRCLTPTHLLPKFFSLLYQLTDKK